MTHAEIMALEAGPETDALVGKAREIEPVLSWRVYGPDDPGAFCYMAGSKREAEAWLAGTLERNPESWLKDHYVKSYEVYRPYSRDIAAAYEAEEALPEDKRRLYADALKQMTVPDRAFGPDYYWDFAHASPLDRCKALLMTLNGENV